MGDDLNNYLKDEFQNNLIPNLSEFIKIPNVSRNYNPNWKTDGL